jgi:hypothetical protein
MTTPPWGLLPTAIGDGATTLPECVSTTETVSGPEEGT